MTHIQHHYLYLTTCKPNLCRNPAVSFAVVSSIDDGRPPTKVAPLIIHMQTAVYEKLLNVAFSPCYVGKNSYLCIKDAKPGKSDRLLTLTPFRHLATRFPAPDFAFLPRIVAAAAQKRTKKNTTKQPNYRTMRNHFVRHDEVRTQHRTTVAIRDAGCEFVTNVANVRKLLNVGPSLAENGRMADAPGTPQSAIWIASILTKIGHLDNWTNT